MYQTLRFTLIILLFNACQTDPNGAEVPADTSYQEEDLAPQANGSNTVLTRSQTATTSRKIIRTADVKFQVKDVEESTEYIKNAVATFQGFIAQMEQKNDNYSIQNHLVIKTPSTQFEPLLEALNQEAIFVNYKKIKSSDVSSEFIDIEARLATKKAVRDRYIDILRNKTGTVKEVLEAEEKIRQIQEEIEAKEARLRHLQAQVRLSTIHLKIYQKVEYRSEPIVYKESFVGQFFNGLNNGWQALLNVLLFFINLWPLILIVGLLFWRRKQIYQRFNPEE